MWPWGHLAVGYLLYSPFAHLVKRRSPSGPAAIALAVGTQFPDLVDKPLAWSFHLLPSGRSLAHSLLTAVVLVAVLEVLLRRRGAGAIATAFGVGYVSHLLGDALTPALVGEYHLLGFLAWPVVPAVAYPTEPSFAAHLADLTLATLLSAQGVLGLLAVALWLFDGRPGFDVVASIPGWVERKLST